MNNKKGFTLVEIIVVLVILAILAGIGLPAYLKYVDESKEKVCKINRTYLVNYYKKYSLLYGEDPTFKEVVEKKDVLPNQFSQDIKTFVCPAGGVFYVDGSAIKCTFHDGNGSDTGNDGGNVEPTKTLGDLSKVKAGNWADLCKVAKSTDKVELEKGSFVIDDENKIYVANTKINLNKVFAEKYENDISNYDSFTYLDPNRPILGPSNVDKSTNTWKVPLTEGAIYQESGETYLYSGNDGQTDKPIPPSGNGIWVRLNLAQ